MKKISKYIYSIGIDKQMSLDLIELNKPELKKEYGFLFENPITVQMQMINDIFINRAFNLVGKDRTLKLLEEAFKTYFLATYINDISDNIELIEKLNHNFEIGVDFIINFNNELREAYIISPKLYNLDKYRDQLNILS